MRTGKTALFFAALSGYFIVDGKLQGRRREYRSTILLEHMYCREKLLQTLQTRDEQKPKTIVLLPVLYIG